MSVYYSDSRRQVLAELKELGITAADTVAKATQMSNEVLHCIQLIAPSHKAFH